ncbi:MAG: endonuclease MutS2 [Clostridia bacterium]|nr:endonuclease MutS2 [Clostridia bacterium]
MNSNLIKLEYNKILERLTAYCKTYIGKEHSANLQPSYNAYDVHNMLKQTSEACTLITKYGNIPIDEIDNITPYVKNLESYIPLTPKALLEIAKILATSNNLKEYFSNSDSESIVDSTNNSNVTEVTQYPLLKPLFEALYSNLGICSNITKAIIDENNIADDASKPLSSLRRNRRRLESGIKEKLNSFIHSSSYSKYIMEPIITIRNDRYVIPVKIEYKENVNGLIHDMSASGSTVYVEPTSVFELNNQINNIKLEENIEIEKILEDLSKQLYPVVDNIKNTVTTIGNIDLVFAKAKFSKEIDGVEPIINADKFIDLMQAKHPLISPDVVVPIDINLGKNFQSLIITGPNTGGKTVTLKTVGLLCLMAYSGLHIPAKETSSIYVFDNIFADIGDEQSIQESLSTFSSHITHIIDILNTSSANSLVLIDELGSGTDPVQGANLAISILESLYKKGTLTLSTTHYSELKNYALVNEGFENASSEFDIENLRPTYKILIGVPGKSNAFAISRRLGLPAEILERAESLLSEDNISIEELIKNIYDDKLLIEREKEKILKNSNQVELLRKQLENDVSDVEARRNDIINSAKNEARNILISAKEEANDIIKELNSLCETSNKASLKNANLLRDKLNSDIKNNLGSDSISEKSENVDEIEISVGLKVLVKPFNMVGTVLTLPNKNNEVFVQFGSTKTNVKIGNLEVATDNKNTSAGKGNSAKNGHSGLSDGFSNNRSSYRSSSQMKSKMISPEINVIGQNVEDAIFVVDKYLDDCYLANLPTARIVHGKGTGKLRDGIHAFLRRHPHVKSFRLGTFGEGEMGVTIVEFK